MKPTNSIQIKIIVIAVSVASIGVALYFTIGTSTADTKLEIGRYSAVQRRIDQLLCPKCNGQMENGFIVDHGHTYSKISSWVQGTPNADLSGVNTEPGSPVVTMRCKACGFLESYAK